MPSPLIEAFDNSPDATQNAVSAQITKQLNELESKINSSTLSYDLSDSGINDFLRNIPQNSKDATTYINSKLSQIGNSLSVFKDTVINPLKSINSNINQASNVNTAANDLNDKIKRLDELKEQLDTLGTDLSTAYTREAVVDTKREAVSYHQTWGMLQRPIRRQSIPVLIIFSLIFLTAAGIGIYYLSPFARQDSGDSGMIRPTLIVGGVTLLICVLIYGVFAIFKLI
jgi:hypothetical protein